MDGIAVRGYRPQDVPMMIEIWNEVVREGVAYPQEDELLLESGRAFFAEQSHCGVAVEAEGTIVGLYILHPNNVGRCGHICNASYAVTGGMRGRHVGEALVCDCMAWGELLGFRILQFNAVVYTNVAARKLYERLGFTPLGVIPGGFRMKDGHYEGIVPYYRTLDGDWMTIRKTRPNELDTLLALFDNARRFMAQNGNAVQWAGGYPTRETLERDIALGQSYVCVEKGHLFATFVLVCGDDPTYRVIDGAWKNNRPYGTLHRIASSGERRAMTDSIIQWAYHRTGNLRGDTHALNLPMQRAFERNGFERCGTIWVEDGSPRIAYQKE